tara:strand:- start:323 stop:2017 length:1695 start_codon:yes stop_codon:yes gene_type:complete
MESRSKGKQLMSRYRKTMRQAMEEGLSNMQLAILKKEYEPFRGKTISAARAKQLMNILDKFKDQDLQKLAKANIPFVSSGSDTKLRVRKMGFKVTTFNPMGSFKEEVTAVYTDKKTRQVKSKKFKDVNTAKDYFRKTGEAAGQINFREEQEITQEDFDLEEGKMKTIATMFSQGKSAEEIAKKMKLPVDTVKNILGENAPTDADMQRMKKLGMKPQKEDLDEKIQPFMISYSDRFGKHAGFEGGNSLQDIQNKAANLRKRGFKIDKMGRYNPPVGKKEDMAEAGPCWTGYKQVGMKTKNGKQVPNCVPEDVKLEEYITEQDDSMTMAKDMKKKKEELPKSDDTGTEADTEKKEKKEGDNVDKLKADIEKKDNEIAMLKTKAETEKAKVAKKETEKMVNPETGEPLLQVGVAYKHLRDKQKKEKVNEADLTKSQIKMVHKKADDLPKKDFKDRYGKEKGDAVRYGTATNIVKKKLGIGEEMKEHPAKAVYEQIAGLKKKAEKSGMPYSILKKVYDRGMAAWRGGHRPGTTQQQWAFARVNSFVTKSSGTWGGADKDLAKQVRGSK